MAVRPIDANALQELCNRRIQDAWNSRTAPVSWAEAYADFKNDIDSIPTLTPPNEPLTLEELRGMDGAPVWVKCLKSNKYINPPTGWRILEKSLAGTFGVWDGENSLIERNYGADWLAYRRPPEEEI